MSMEVLRALAGSERVDAMTVEERQQLCHAIDAEILKDKQLLDRLLRVVEHAAAAN